MGRGATGRGEGKRERGPGGAASWSLALAAQLALACAARAPAPAEAPVGRTSTIAAAAAEGGDLDPLIRVNGDFHSRYAAARGKEQATLGRSRPYLSLGGEKLVLRYRGVATTRSLASARFDAVKHAGHGPIAAVSAILAGGDPKTLREIAARLRLADAAITASKFGDAEPAARGVTRASIELLEAAQTKAVGDAELREFGRRTRADTNTLLQAGCDELLARLDAAARELRPLAGDAWPQAVVTIATDHQSRAEEVGTQYFEHLFHERALEGALGESRIVVIEAIGPNDGPEQAMASHLYDQRLSTLLFDDPAFLQGDVLGKHAEATIARLLATPF